MNRKTSNFVFRPFCIGLRDNNALCSRAETHFSFSPLSDEFLHAFSSTKTRESRVTTYGATCLDGRPSCTRTHPHPSSSSLYSFAPFAHIFLYSASQSARCFVTFAFFLSHRALERHFFACPWFFFLLNLSRASV